LINAQDSLADPSKLVQGSCAHSTETNYNYIVV
jgi:hypothetical protein